MTNQSRRTGSAVASAANFGATGLTNLVSAGLAAYTTLKSIQSIMASIKNSATYGSELSRLAPEIGGATTQWFDAFAIAANKKTAVSKEAVLAEMAADSKFLEDWRQNRPDVGRIQEMTIRGIIPSREDTVQSLQEKVANRTSQMSPGAAASLEAAIGYSVRGRFLRQGNRTVNSQVANEMSVAATEGVAKAYDRLRESIASVFAAYDGLVNKFIEENPGLTLAIERVDKWLRDLQSTPEGLKKVSIALNAVSIGMVAVVTKFALLNPTLRLLLMVAAAYTAIQSLSIPSTETGFRDPDPKNRPTWGEVGRSFLPWNWKMFGGDPSKPRPYPWAPKERPGLNEPIQRRPRHFRDPIQQGAMSFDQVRQLALDVGFKGRAADEMAAIVMAESGGNIHAVGDNGNSHGLTQIHEPTWGPVAREAKGNARRAMELAYMVHGKRGNFNDWTTYKNKEYLKHLPPSTSGTRSLGQVSATKPPIGVGSIPNPFGTGPDLTLLKSLKTIQAAKAAQAAASGGANNSYDNDMNIGNIAINTQANNAGDIAKDLRKELNNSFRFWNINPFNEAFD